MFGVVALTPAATELLVGRTPIVPGIFFASFSVINIWLLKRIAQRLGASDTESVLAAGLLAMSSSWFYFSRHLMPYDVAMTFGLLALHAGARPGGSARTSRLCGFFAACAFLTYAGYWTLAAATMMIHAALSEDRYDLVRRGLDAGFGFVLTVGAVAVASTALGGHVVQGSAAYSGTITQGTFEEGWRLPWEYLWHSEHILLLAWLISFLWAIRRVALDRQSPRLTAGLIGVASIYLMLVVSSTVLEIFVVYGRLVRQLVPFFCLLTAAAVERAFASGSEHLRVLARAGLVALLLQASTNFLSPLRQAFPADFIRAGRDDERYGPDLVLVFAHHIYPEPEPVALPARYSVLRAASHPLEFRPYQYEAFTPSEREVIRAADISMRILVPLSD